MSQRRGPIVLRIGLVFEIGNTVMVLKNIVNLRFTENYGRRFRKLMYMYMLGTWIYVKIILWAGLLWIFGTVLYFKGSASAVCFYSQ